MTNLSTLGDNWKTIKEHKLRASHFDDCSKCGCKPMLWLYDNGMMAVCECIPVDNCVRSESIYSHMKRTGSTVNWVATDGLINNWNSFASCGIIVSFKKSDMY